jgi:hypothetical protein
MPSMLNAMATAANFEPPYLSTYKVDILSVCKITHQQTLEILVDAVDAVVTHRHGRYYSTVL